MFGLSLPCQLIQGPAVRTWNCVAHFANLLWCKFNYVTNPIMPRSRRRHHSRSRTRSRSRSQSCDRDRDTKRRKIENYESPHHKRSDSPEDDLQSKMVDNSTSQEQSLLNNSTDITTSEQKSNVDSEVASENTPKPKDNVVKPTVSTTPSKTPKKSLTPKQLKKKLESEERQKERDRIKEEKLKLLEERKKLKQEENEKRIKEKQEKIEEKQKMKDLKEEKKKKEREDRENKRKEKEEKDEQKRKEKEEKEEQKRKEQDEKNKEKQKMEEKKQKAATVFVSFFKKKNDSVDDEKKLEKPVAFTFMPFEVKSDMRLAPLTRVTLDSARKEYVLEILGTQLGPSYLDELKSGKKIGKGFKTWPYSDPHCDDVVIVEDTNPGESIEEQSKFPLKQKVKFLKFEENRRPAYFGTWRKKSVLIKPRRPFAIDSTHFDYDIDSDEEWEEEDSGESLQGSDDDKENESENEYEEDNEFFVPHGHLSDDEVNDEENSIISPEAHKAKLKLLKKKFEEEMQSKTEKIKPRLIGCIWYNKDGSNVDAAIDEFLKPLSIISNGSVVIKKRSKYVVDTPLRRSFLRGKELSAEFIPNFLKWVHGSTKNSKSLVQQFLTSLQEQNIAVEVSRTKLIKQLKKLAVWTRAPEGGPILKKYCWFVHKDVSKEYNVDLPTPI